MKRKAASLLALLLLVTLPAQADHEKKHHQQSHSENHHESSGTQTAPAATPEPEADPLEALIPADAEITADQTLGDYRMMTLTLPSGEVLLLLVNAATGQGLALNTQVAAQCSAAAVPTADEAASMVLADYPEANIFSTKDNEDGSKRLLFFTSRLCGEIAVCGEGILYRSLSCGSYAENGVLTMEGALAVLRAHRPEAQFRALEQDEDDGLIVYEGEALVNGVEYEFELNARSGRLLEWERD